MNLQKLWDTTASSPTDENTAFKDSLKELMSFSLLIILQNKKSSLPEALIPLILGFIPVLEFPFIEKHMRLLYEVKPPQNAIGGYKQELAKDIASNKVHLIFFLENRRNDW